MDIVSPKTALHHTATLRRMQGWLLDILMNRSLALLNKVHRAELTAKFVQKKAKASRSCVSTAVVKRPRKNIPHKRNRLTKKNCTWWMLPVLNRVRRWVFPSTFLDCERFRSEYIPPLAILSWRCYNSHLPRRWTPTNDRLHALDNPRVRAEGWLKHAYNNNCERRVPAPNLPPPSEDSMSVGKRLYSRRCQRFFVPHPKCIRERCRTASRRRHKGRFLPRGLCGQRFGALPLAPGKG